MQGSRFRELINDLKVVDRKAALILAKRIPLAFRRNNRIMLDYSTKDLDECMYWTATPQGNKYWYEVHKKLYVYRSNEEI